MHIALCGPASLEMLSEHLVAQTRPVLQHVGYPFPLLPTLADAFVKRGHRVSIVTTSPDADTVMPYLGTDLSVVVAPSRLRARSRAADLFAVERAGVAEALRMIRPDVVHAHWTYEFALGALREKAAPTVVTAHDAPLTVLKHMPDAYRLVRAAMATWTRLRRPNLTAVSPYLAERWRREMLFRANIDVIPNPAPLKVGGVTGRVVRHVGPVILSVSDGSRRKNVRTLLRAFPLLADRHPGAELRLVGNGLGPDDELCRAWLSTGRSASVSFLGRLSREALEAEYAKATVFCHTSLEESQGLVLLEAVQHGIPVVAGRDSGAVGWTLFDGAAGVLTDVRSPTAVADAVTSVLQGSEADRLAAFDGRREVEARFGADVIAGRYLAKYERIMRGTPN